VVYDAIGAAPEVRELPDPVAPAGGVVVQVHANGL
jgi:alcohol dehydrogenase